ncbi:MAG: hypothetical protein DMG49_02360 [Acidobacteria bacterium]|nr:MAG: hypothetical protein DMG49_02360 [Acidobacteriota bacterium]
MADEFDGQAEAESFASLVRDTSNAVRSEAPTSSAAPLFRKLEDGSIVNRNGQVIRGPVAPLEGKGK